VDVCGLGSFDNLGFRFELCRRRNVVGREDASKGGYPDSLVEISYKKN
jgi:hypothetical protein